MVVRCEDVWREISNYIDGDVEPELRAAMDAHIRGCERCTAVLAGTKNIVALYGDERMVEVPLGFGQRLYQRLEETMPRRRGSALGWTIAFAFAAMLILSFEVGNSPNSHPFSARSEHAQPGEHIPRNLAVVVENTGKLFHVAGCPFIKTEGGVRSVTAEEALKEGYTPCVRCLRKYLDTAQGHDDSDSDESTPVQALLPQ